MKTKKTAIVLAIVSVLVMAATAFAGMGGHGNCGPHGGMNNNNQNYWNSMTEEQQTKYTAIHDEYIASTNQLREDMWAKHVELEALSDNPNTKPEMITKLVQDMKELRAKMNAARDAFNERIKKEVGVEPFKGRFHGGEGMRGGMGKGNCAGMGKGRGMPKGMKDCPYANDPNRPCPMMDQAPAEPPAN